MHLRGLTTETTHIKFIELVVHVSMFLDTAPHYTVRILFLDKQLLQQQKL